MRARTIRIRRSTPAGGSPPAPISSNRRRKTEGSQEETVAGEGKGGNGAPELETETGTSAETSGRSWYRSRGGAKCGRRRLKRMKERERERGCVYTYLLCSNAGCWVFFSSSSAAAAAAMGSGWAAEMGWDWRMESVGGRGRSEAHRNLRRERVARCTGVPRITSFNLSHVCINYHLHSVSN